VTALQVLRHPAVATGGAVLALLVAAAVLAPWLGTVDPQAISPLSRLKPPSSTAWFGSDVVGRDLYSRTLHGARLSLVVGVSVALLATVIGLAIGVLAGFSRGFDAVAMRVMDGMMAIPAILLAVAMIALTGASLQNVIIAITVSEVPRVARLVRGVVLQLKASPFVEAALVAGTRLPALLLRHILPNAAAPLLVQASYMFASAILVEAALSFIGAGSPPSLPSWGNLIAEGRTVFQIAPHIVFFPGLALAVTVLAVNLLGDGLRDVLDPRFERR
jgi:peptide/nickel transport system permease protein